MPALNLTAIDPAQLQPLPDPPVFIGPQDDEERHVRDLVLEGLSSGPLIPLDDAFFAQINAIIANPA